jgi:hypothetical protein
MRRLHAHHVCVPAERYERERVSGEKKFVHLRQTRTNYADDIMQIISPPKYTLKIAA